MATKDKEKETLVETKVALESVRLAVAVTTAVDEDKRTMVATIASEALSHGGQVVNISGIDLTIYRANPVVLWSHMSWMPPMGVNLWIKRDGNKLVAKTRFAERPKNHEGQWFPDTLLALYAQGVLKGVSVGLKVTEVKYSDDIAKEDRQAFPALDQKGAWALIKKSILLEYSCCSIPANPEALRKAYAAGMQQIPPEMEKMLAIDEIVPPEETAEIIDIVKQAEEAEKETLAVELGISQPHEEPTEPMHTALITPKEELHDLKTLTYPYMDILFHVDWGLKEDGTKALQAIRYPADKWNIRLARTHCQTFGCKIFTPTEVETAVLPPAFTEADMLQAVEQLKADPAVLEELTASLDLQGIVQDAADIVCGRV